MKGKLLISFLLCLILGVSVTYPIYFKKEDIDIITQTDNWIKDGNTVYVNDSNIYASATPHTLGSDGWVTFNFIPKTYTGNIDIIWGFDSDTATPKMPQILCNYTHEIKDYHYVDKIGSVILYNVTGYESLDIDNYDNYTVRYGNKNNIHLFSVNHSNITEIVAFSSFDISSSTYTLTGHYDKYEEYTYYKDYIDWKSYNTNFDIINHSFGGMDKWFLLKNISVISGNNYTLRAWIDIPFNGLDGSSGKYWWAFKPSSETLQQSITNDHFYCIDPWWDSSWDYYKQITIDSSQIPSTQVNFPILLNFTDSDLISHAQADGDDICFVLTDNSTQLNHEIEEYDNVTGKLIAWINVTSLLHDSDLAINMYYGNDACVSQEHITDTWDSHFLVVLHFPDNDTTMDSTINSWDFTNSGTDLDSDGMIGTGRNWDATANDFLAQDTLFDDSPDKWTIEGWINKDIGSTEMWFFEKSADQDQDQLWIRCEGDNGLDYRTEGANGGYNTVSHAGFVENIWTYVTAMFSCSGGDTQYLIIDGDSKSNIDSSTNCLQTDSDWPFYLGRRRNTLTVDFDGQMDEVRISDSIRSDAWIITTFNTITNASLDCANPFIKSVSGEKAAPPTIAWQQVLKGYFTFSNITSTKLVASGYFTFSNSSSNNLITSGYFTFSNVASQQSALSGYFTFGNSSSVKQSINGFFTFGNISSNKNVISGYFTFGNYSVNKLVQSGYFTFGNISSNKLVQSGYFTFINYSTIKQVQSGYFTLNNNDINACFTSTQIGNTIRCDASCSSDADEYRWTFEHEDGTTGTTGWIDGDNAGDFIATSLEIGRVTILLEIHNSTGATSHTSSTFDIGEERDILPIEECSDTTECEDNGYYWWDDECHLEEKPDWWTSDENTTNPQEYQEPSNLKEGEWQIEPTLFIIPVGLLALLYFYRRRKVYKKKTYDMGDKYLDIWEKER